MPCGIWTSSFLPATSQIHSPMNSTRTLRLASSRPTVVLANGVFDIFHYGHLLYLQAAAMMGDKLVVAVTRNVYVKTIGKAVKENALSSLFIKREQFYGGVWAAKNHLKTFCRDVDYLGGAEDMVNSRMVDDVYLRKLFVTHELRPTTERVDPVD